MILLSLDDRLPEKFEFLKIFPDFQIFRQKMCFLLIVIDDDSKTFVDGDKFEDRKWVDRSGKMRELVRHMMMCLCSLVKTECINRIPICDDPPAARKG